MKTTIIHRYWQQVICSIVFFISMVSCYAQYDTLHYIPPAYSRSSATGELGMSYLFLSTNTTSPFDVTVIQGDGTIIDIVSISRDNPAEIHLGFQYNAIGIVDQSGLNTPLNDQGIIASGAQPFFANLRHSSAAQGMSLTSKGTAALGTRFRSGHLYTVESTWNDGALKSHLISVMATEDNTTITFSDFKDGVIFHGTPTNGNTSENISVTLNKHESYIIAAHLDEHNATGNDTLINGVLVESTLPIVMNSGSWCGGANVVSTMSSRDIGMDQIIPTSSLKTKHIVVKRFSYLEEECERVIVIADADGTEIYINGNVSPYTLLNAGEFIILPASVFDINDILFIESSSGVYVYQSTNGSADYSNSQGLNFIPPVSCTGLNEVTIPNVHSFSGAPAGIDIIAKVGSTVYLNNVPLSTPSFPVTGNQNWEVYKLSGLTGTLHIRSDNAINVAMITHMGAKGAAGYFSGFNNPSLHPEIEFNSINGGDRIAEECMDGIIRFTKPDILLNEDITYHFSLTGNAINGIDYTAIPESIFIPAGSLQGSLVIHALEDGIIENAEDIVLTWTGDDPCDPISIVKTLTIEKQPEINFSIQSGIQCTPFAATFINQSDVDANASYFWDFGDGTSSTMMNPTHLYESDGLYPVTLVIETTLGCQDTLSLTLQDLVNTHPKPQADFSVDKYHSDICNAEIRFTNTSQGATDFFYFFDDGEANTTEANPSHDYRTGGMRRPSLIVTSEFGCTDTVYQEVFIEPFSVYAPNAFTPNGDEFNTTFLPVANLEIGDWQLEIFNRWGELIFTSLDSNFGWDGTTQTGELSPNGTYIWQLHYTPCDPRNITKQSSGSVHLLR